LPRQRIYNHGLLLAGTTTAYPLRVERGCWRFSGLRPQAAFVFFSLPAGKAQTGYGR